MRNCPHCQVAPIWHLARGLTMRGNEGVPRDKWTSVFLFSPGCPHAEAYAKPMGPVLEKDQPDAEAKWDAHAEVLFAAYTARWTEAERVRFRDVLWPKPPAVVPTELFNRYHDEAPAAF